jgi:hypothetical protein
MTRCGETSPADGNVPLSLMYFLYGHVTFYSSAAQSRTAYPIEDGEHDGFAGFRIDRVLDLAEC